MGRFTDSLVVIEEGGEIRIVSSLCDLCAHLGDNETCKAFPNGIPEEILTGDHDHTEPYPGDNGIQFEPMEPEEQSA